LRPNRGPVPKIPGEGEKEKPKLKEGGEGGVDRPRGRNVSGEKPPRKTGDRMEPGGVTDKKI